ncbi:glycosyltransferase [Blastococcus sp. TBT05-19]|uniref:glycosyltransferase n=1 Tax=Blastococcus sp. TBT05-19 TaxID=2250581 RepID=UPI001313EAE0|nr:glycosyltransferase [Blastococcus sp. TBT05-19]
MQAPALLTYNPLHAAFGDHGGFRSVTYVGRDDWSAHHGHSAFAEVYQAAYDSISDRGLRVAAVSQQIIDRISPRGPSRVVPNGVDPQVWGGPPPAQDPLEAFLRPIGVYTGTVDERLSATALANAAPHFGSILLVGPEGDDTGRRLATTLSNVHMLPSMDQTRLAATVMAADVCLVPHVVSALTEAMSPLKVYEYLAAGRPVVATDLPPIRHIHPSIVLSSVEQFGQNSAHALARGPLDEDERQRFIDENSWAQRCDALLDLALSHD